LEVVDANELEDVIDGDACEQERGDAVDLDESTEGCELRRDIGDVSVRAVGNGGACFAHLYLQVLS